MGDTANFTEYIQYLYKMRDKNRFRYDKSMGDYQTWAKHVREVLAPHFTLCDDGTPLYPKILRTDQMDGYRQETLEISINGYLRLRGYALVPDNGEEKHPAVILLSGHGWQYYYDIVKMLNNGQENDPMIKENRELRYGGRSVAIDLAKMGYFVMYFETFYFGNYNLDVEHVPQLFKDEFHVDPAKFKKDSEEYKVEYNLFCRRFEAYMYKYLAFAGQSWCGLLLDEDKKAVDYLMTRDDVDPNRIGCLGLSLGGFRSMMLTGMDERIKCAVVAGWMCSQAAMIKEHCRYHTFMMFQPSLWSLIDFPDLAALNAPNALLVLNGIHDEQFVGVHDADDRMRKVYEEAGCPEKYACNFYDAPHCFNPDMQKDAYAFMETHLRNI